METIVERECLGEETSLWDTLPVINTNKARYTACPTQFKETRDIKCLPLLHLYRELCRDQLNYSNNHAYQCIWAISEKISPVIRSHQ